MNINDSINNLKYYILGDSEPTNDNIHDVNIFARKVRKGQEGFRRKLMKLYKNKCAISNFNIPEVLDVAHIFSHSESGINPNSYKIEISNSLKKSEYWQYNGNKINQTIAGKYPDKHYLDKHYK